MCEKIFTWLTSDYFVSAATRTAQPCRKVETDATYFFELNCGSEFFKTSVP